MVDLHIHTALSPCASDDMTPDNIVAASRERNLDVIGIADHNSAANVRAVVAAADSFDLVVLPCLEVQTSEEVHVLCVFDDLESVAAWQEHVYRHLPDRANDEEIFGRQHLYDESGILSGSENQLLLVSADLTLESVFEVVSVLGGVCIPAHVDRRSFGLLGVLGFVPESLDISAVEVSPNFPGDDGLSIPDSAATVRFSDAHTLSDLGNQFTTMWMEAPTVECLMQAFRGDGGRRVKPRFARGD